MKPLLRGVLHPFALVAALVGWGVLLSVATTPRATVAACIYGASLATMFAVSGLYHWPTWSPRVRTALRGADHAAIFVLIAGTYTPLCLALAPTRGIPLLGFVATGAAFGIAKAILFPNAPRYVGVPIYLALGWAVFPLVPSVHAEVGARGIVLLAAGGIAYTAGAVIYWIRRPDPFPTVFGYHEIFHVLVVVAAACHFAVVLPVVRTLR